MEWWLILILCLIGCFTIASFFFTSKINISKIIVNHWATLGYPNKKRVMMLDIACFVGLPILVGVFVGFQNLNTQTISTTLITVFAIFAGLLMNLIVLTINIDYSKKFIEIKEEDKRNKKIEVHKKICDETFFNISHAILLSIVIIVLSAVITNGVTNSVLANIINGVLFGLSTMFILNLMMILKRIYSLYKRSEEKQ